MLRSSPRLVAPLVCLLALAAPSVSAITLLRMGLGDLSERAGRIFRGRVVEVREETATVGGSVLPTTVYLLQVEERFKGDYPTDKQAPLVELRTIGKLPEIVSGGLRHRNPLAEVPQLELGRSYLLFLTVPGPIGLSSPVGLGQGCFDILGSPGRESVRNGYDNLGLATESRLSDLAPRGPIPYERMAAELRALLSAEATP